MKRVAKITLTAIGTVAVALFTDFLVKGSEKKQKDVYCHGVGNDENKTEMENGHPVFDTELDNLKKHRVVIVTVNAKDTDISITSQTAKPGEFIAVVGREADENGIKQYWCFLDLKKDTTTDIMMMNERTASFIMPNADVEICAVNITDMVETFNCEEEGTK